MSKLDDILKLSKDNDGEYYVAQDATNYHDEQKRQLKDLMLEIINNQNKEFGDSWSQLIRKIEEL